MIDALDVIDEVPELRARFDALTARCWRAIEDHRVGDDLTELIDALHEYNDFLARLATA